MTQSNIESTFKVDILDYMGKFEGGIIVQLNIFDGESHYNGTFFYTEDTIALTVDDNLETKLKTPIEDHPEYKKIVFDLLKKVVPHNELINSIDDIDLTEYVK